MKNYSKTVPFILFTLLIVLKCGLFSYAQGQTQLLDSISIQVEEFNNTYPQEKIYLHFDKPFYIPGETIWYKAYYVNTSGNSPSSLSNIMYTELLNKTGEIIIHQILKLGNGIAKGEFLLPESLPQGQYLIRAYTNWMRNFDHEFFFTKYIMVFDPQKEYEITANDSSEQEMVEEPGQEKIDLQFFPEGGYLVSELTSKVAFKAINGSGKGIHVKGEITDEEDNVIIPFESFHLGMGVFFLKPEKNKTYFAKITQGNDKRLTFQLPNVSETGLVMAVDSPYGDVISVFIQANATFLNNHSGDIFIVVQAAGKIHYTAHGNFNGTSSLIANIAKKDLPTGIAQITLFNAKGDPECERLVFINPHNDLEVKIETEKKTYNPREKILLNISVKNAEGNPVEGNFSLAVTDAGQVINLEKNSDNILTNLLLTSELKGNIEQPAFYFLKDNPSSETALDYLLLTQGWRRFTWKEMLNNKWPAIIYDFEKDVILKKGQVLYHSNDMEKRLTRVSYLTLQEKKPHNIFTDDNGIFHFSINARYGKESMFFDVTDAKGQRNKFNIVFENNSPGFQPEIWNEILFVNSKINNCLETRKFKAQVESSFNYSAENNLFYNAEPEISDLSKKTNGYFERADYTIRLDKYNPFSTMAEVFREVVTQVSFQYKKGENRIRVYSEEYMKNFDRQPLFIIDDIPTFNKTFVLDLDPGIVETIEVTNSIQKLRKLGFLGHYGVIAISTKDGITKVSQIPDNNIIEFQGCYRSREFYSPEYKLSTETDRGKPDLRSLVYWNPSIITNSNGKASVTFYNTDNITTIDARVEGISYNGTPGLANYRYDIIPRKLTAVASEDK